MTNTASAMRARALLRRYVWSTVGLGVFFGVAAGAALGIWGVARRTSTVFDRFVAYSDEATITVFACTDGVDAATIETSYSDVCADYDYADILDFLHRTPGVESAGRWTLAISWVAPAHDPGAGSRQLVPVVVDEDAMKGVGTPIMVDGRLLDPSVASEVVINEEAAARMEVGVGDELLVTPYRMDEFDAAGEGSRPPSGEPTEVTIVGVGRTPGDLAGRLGGTSIYEDSSSVTAGPAWWRETGGDAARYGIGVVVKTTPGSSDDEVVQAMHERWPDRPIQVDVGSLSADPSRTSVVDAIRLQSLGLQLVASVVALAALVFAGQAVARQARREWADATVLDALGMTRPGMASAQLLRAAAIAVVAVGVAAVVTIASSPLGPVGIGRAAEPYPGVSVDGVVLLVGLPVIALAVMVFSIVPVITIRRRDRAESFSTSTSRTIRALPPAGTAGWAMTRSHRAGGVALASAVVGVALACAAAVAAWSLVASYGALLGSPERYGATWDVQVGNVGSEEQEIETKAKLQAIPGIRSVGILSAEGIGAQPNAVIVAPEPFMGAVQFGAVTAGRVPTSPTEVALGRRTMRAFGASIGDTVELGPPGDPSNLTSFEVVGEAAINDGLTARPGDGALVTTDAMRRMGAGTRSQSYAVWIDPGVDHEATVDALRAAFPTTTIVDRVPRQIQNLGLVSGQPALLALFIGLLAAAALTHALVTSIRRGRRQLGILMTLGFTRRQVVATVSWHASFIALAAVAIGVPVGVVTGRLVWGAIVDGLGVVSPPVVPTSALVVAIVAVLVVANLAALGAVLAGARGRPAEALRSE